MWHGKSLVSDKCLHREDRVTFLPEQVPNTQRIGREKCCSARRPWPPTLGRFTNTSAMMLHQQSSELHSGPQHWLLGFLLPINLACTSEANNDHIVYGSRRPWGLLKSRWDHWILCAEDAYLVICVEPDSLSGPPSHTVWMLSPWWCSSSLAPDFYLYQILLLCQEGASILSLTIMHLIVFPVHIRLSTTHYLQTRWVKGLGRRRMLLTHLHTTKFMSKNYLPQTISRPSNSL